ncbi:hypothetical protein K0M31_015322, partial [Melipona bicolor]
MSPTGERRSRKERIRALHEFEIGREACFRAVLLESSPIAIRGPAGFVRNRYAANLPPAGNLRPTQ